MERDVWNIIAKKISGEPVDAFEQAMLDDWLNSDENLKQYQEALLAGKNTDLFLKLKQYNTAQAWDKMERKANQRTKIRRLTWAVTAAAAVLLLFVVTQLLLPENSKSEVQLQVFATEVDDFTRPEVYLPDGSVVTLNKNSKLSYPETFSDTMRLVHLSGEAFFAVASNQDVPFMIQTTNAIVKVLGTSFNVLTNEGNESTEVLVQTGAVELMPHLQIDQIAAKTVVLFPGERGLSKAKANQVVKESTFDINRLAWFTQSLKFDAVPLADVLKLISETYNVQVEAGHGLELSQPISATFEKQDAEYVIGIIALTLGLEVVKQSDFTYVIQKK